MPEARLQRRAYWTLLPLLRRRLVDSDSGQVIEAERFRTAGLLEAALAEAAALRRLPEPEYVFYVADTSETDEGGAWPGRVHRYTGVGTELVARCESVVLATELADLLNRREARAARPAEARYGSRL